MNTNPPGPPLTCTEWGHFVALLIAMGINKSTQCSMYWSTSEVLRMPLYPSIMPRNRFSDIMRFVHLSNNQIPEPASVKCHKLNKLRPLLDCTLPKFGSLYYPGQNLSPDESMPKFKGRLSFLQYMSRKPVKWGHEGILFEWTSRRRATPILGLCTQDLLPRRQRLQVGHLWTPIHPHQNVIHLT